MHKNFLLGKLKSLVDEALDNNLSTGFASPDKLSERINELTKQASEALPESQKWDLKMGALFSVMMNLQTLSFIQGMYMIRMIEFMSETLDPTQWEKVVEKVKTLSLEDVSWPSEFGK